jgi:predicted dienelactone hydrolase
MGHTRFLFTLLTLAYFSSIPFLSAATYPVGVASKVTLHDGTRNRDVPLLVYYPKSKNPERFPIILFSHDATSGIIGPRTDMSRSIPSTRAVISPFSSATNQARTFAL